MESFDIVIVGAGIIGTAVARECALAGLRVGVIEGDVLGGGITAAGMGHVVVMDDSPAQLALSSYSSALWREEMDRLPAQVEYVSTGTVWVAADDEEMAEVRAKQATYLRAGIRSHVLDAALLAKEEPNLRAGLAGGLLVPDDGVVYPPAAAGYFLQQAAGRGCTLFNQRAVAAGYGEVQLADGTRLAAERIVLAAGFDCALLPAMPIQRRKGHLVITDRYPGFAFHQLVELGYLKSAHALTADSVAFNIQPRRTGQMLIGSSRQFGSADKAVDAVILHRMLQRAEEYMPGIAALSSIRIWTGFRASTNDKLPLIGPALGLSDDPSLWLASGFEGLGITNAPGAARILVDGMLGRASVIDRTPYLPERLLRTQEPAHA
jgi:glycine/D-amino acid oxidase-like deaminating enzyme